MAMLCIFVSMSNIIVIDLMKHGDDWDMLEVLNKFL